MAVCHLGTECIGCHGRKCADSAFGCAGRCGPRAWPGRGRFGEPDHAARPRILSTGAAGAHRRMGRNGHACGCLSHTKVAASDEAHVVACFCWTGAHSCCGLARVLESTRTHDVTRPDRSLVALRARYGPCRRGSADISYRDVVFLYMALRSGRRAHGRRPPQAPKALRTHALGDASRSCSCGRPATRHLGHRALCNARRSAQHARSHRVLLPPSMAVCVAIPCVNASQLGAATSRR